MAGKTYHLQELPPRSLSSPGAFELVCEGAGLHRRFVLPEGISEVGSGASCAIVLDQTGLRRRHFAIKCESGRVFVRLLSGSATLGSVPLAETIVAWLPGDTLAAGRLRFRVESVVSADRAVAVEIPRLSVRGYLEGDPSPSDAALGQLERLGSALDAGYREGVIRYDRVLEALSPNAASLHMGTSGVWQTLAELAPTDGVSSLPEPDAFSEPGWIVLDEPVGDDLLRLHVQSTHEAWSRALGRFALRVIAAGLREGRAVASVAGPQDSGRAVEMPWDEFVGSRIRRVLSDTMPICRFAHSVLILGETGTGKELAARALHRQWQRSGPFVAINCAALPEALLDAELFGVESGAATGVAARPGRFEQAEGGTLFLDEISEMPLPLQSKLLRVLQERSFYRVGGSTLLQADVYIVASSNRDEQDLRSGDALRTDLFFRLAQGTLMLPPLRERTEDLAALCAHYLGMLEAQFGRGVRGLSASALDTLKAHAWPGNVRELQNVLRALYARAPRDGLVRASDLPEGIATPAPETGTTPRTSRVANGTLAEQAAAVEQEAIQAALAQESSVSSAAARLGISTSYLYRKIKKYGLTLSSTPDQEEPQAT